MVCYSCGSWCVRPIWVELRNGQWICFHQACAGLLINAIRRAMVAIDDSESDP
jgi:hypothetical protein